MIEPALEKQYVVFNNTAHPYPSKTLNELFEDQVTLTPDNISLYHGRQSITYQQLNNKANQLARHLKKMGVANGDNVAILSDRGFDLIAGLFAILKCGAAYVPIEPDYPADRQKYILSNSAAKFLLVHTAGTITDHSDICTVIDLHTVPLTDYDTQNVNEKIDGRQLAYTIYTSGSTGLPKGVMIAHHSATNLVHWVNKTFHVGPDDRLLFVTSVCFDLSVYDIFGILSSGGALVIADKKDIYDISALILMMQRYHITFWDSVPTTMDALVSRLASSDPEYRQLALRLVFMSGDWIPVPLPDKIKTYFPNAQVISLGGATEATVWSNYYPIEKVDPEQRSIPYGRPIWNNSFYILDEQLQPVPLGETGELFIGGAGVAGGYANDTEKTAKAFLPDPFHSEWGGMMYRTGDLGRMLPDMNMEFIGRKDNQVKIRGFRVELGEIESVMRQLASVKSAVVLYDRDKKQLAGYVVPGLNYNRAQLLDYLRSKLTEYMIPNRWVELETMPLTANGKTDTNALRAIRADDTPRTESGTPATELEQKIAAVWETVLGIKEVGTKDNFFDLGGQSLLAVEVISILEKELGRSLAVNILYRHGTIAELADYISKSAESKQWKCLVPIRSTGNKMALYIVPGDGVNVSNFQNLAGQLDVEQPVYSFKPIGLSGLDEPETISEIARFYVSELLEHDPHGPYALSGYSFGGYVAVEMRRQLQSLGKQVKMLAIFDTDVSSLKVKKGKVSALPARVFMQVPKMLFIAQSAVKYPLATFGYQRNIISRRFNNLFYSIGIRKKPEVNGVSQQIDHITSSHTRAYRNYEFAPFDDRVVLFKAKRRLYFVRDNRYLGWKDYALRGVHVLEIPGDHKTMFFPPNVAEMGRQMQQALDNC